MAQIFIGRGARKTSKPQVDFIPEGAGLPCESYSGSQVGWAAACFLIATGAVIAAVLIVTGQMAAPLPVVAVLALFALGAALGGAAAARHFDHLTITSHEVHRCRRSLLGAKEWHEPLSAYQGVLMRLVHHSGGQNRPSYTEYILDLKHPTDDGRTVRLYCSRSSEGFRSVHERYAKCLGLSALLKTKDGIAERRVEDLDKSIRERVAEGALDVDFDPSAPPPGDRLNVAIQGDAMIVSTRRDKMGKVLKTIAAAMVISGVGLIVAGILARKAPLGFTLPLFGVIDLALVAVLIMVVRHLGQELLIMKDAVRSYWRHPWGKFADVTVPADEIEEVVVRTPPGSQGSTVVMIISDERTAWFGMGLSQAEKEWVRDCIIAVISA